MFKRSASKAMAVPAFSLLLLLLPTTGIAKPRTKVYPVSCEKVWRAVEAVAKEHYNQSLSVLDNQKLRADLTIGKHSFATAPRTINLSLAPSETGCEVAIDGNFSGLAHNDKGDLFKRIDEATLRGRNGTSESSR
jgi:hypothetical protein